MARMVGAQLSPHFGHKFLLLLGWKCELNLFFTNVGKVFCVDVECVAIGRSHDISARSPCSVALVNGQEEVLLKAKNNAIGARRST